MRNSQSALEVSPFGVFSGGEVQCNSLLMFVYSHLRQIGRFSVIALW